MTTSLASSAFVWLKFDKTGALLEPDALARLDAALVAADATDLVILSHGWKNDAGAAMKIYDPLWTNTSAALTRLDPRRIVVAGVLWPSVPHQDDFDEAALLQAAEGGGLAAGDGGGVEDLDEDRLQAVIDAFLGEDDDPELRRLALSVSGDLSGGEANALLQRALARLDPRDPETRDELTEVSQRAGDGASDLMLALAGPPAASLDPALGGALGVGSAVGQAVSGGRAAVARLLGQLTFFDMKVRAGVVGVRLGAILAGRGDSGVRLHLVGHSFGARLVTAAVDTVVKADGRVASLTLLQGAFSHNALAPLFEGKPGGFAAVAKGGVGVIAITHTHNDKACTLAYALASRISRDVAVAIGDANDRFGAMGANGAQGMGASAISHDQRPVAGGPGPVPGKINNYRADDWIVGKPVGQDAHGDVSNETVGQLLASVLEA